MDNERWRKLDMAHHLHPFTDHRALTAQGGSRIITRGEGVYIYDAEKRRLIDGMAGLWNVAIGYGRMELVDAAERQMRELPYYNTFFDTATPPAVELAELLTSLAPKGLDHIFFASSGSEANDTNIRLVRRYWQLEGKPEKRIIISRQYAYHGSTIIGSSLSGLSAMHRQGGLLPDFEHIMPPYQFELGADMASEDFGHFAADALETKIIELGPENVAAFIGEPVQGAGGIIVPPASYWPRIQKICRNYNVLLIADEVICGFGRTGNWFGSDTYGIKPDLMTVAKAITSGYQPLSAAIVGERVAERLIESGEVFYHGFTSSGHPVACAVGLANLKIIRDEGMVKRVREETGPYFLHRLSEKLAEHPIVGEVRGVGLLAAIELVKSKPMRARFEPAGKAAQRCFAHGLQHGVIMRAIRECIALAPPLVITRHQIDEMVELVRKSLDDTAREFGIKA